MEFEREARTVDYSSKHGLLHEEFEIPADSPDWLRTMIADRSVSGASEQFWNKVEIFEQRSDAQLAKDVTIALPIELSAEESIALVRDFVARHITAQGMVADWVFHDAPGNPHIHLMTTLRPLTEDGFGSKKVAVLGADGRPVRNDAGKIVYELWAGGAESFKVFRDGWFACQNRHLALAGLEIRVDGRSFERQGIALEPTIHLGVGTKAIERKAEGSDKKAALERLELQEERRAENARRIQRDPEIVLDLIAREKSVFDERDVAKVLHRYIDEPDLFHSLLVRILQSPEALRIDRERLDFATGVRAPSKYTTRGLIQLEAQMANRAIWLSRQRSHGVRGRTLAATLLRHLQLSDEQKVAIEHVAGPQRIAAVIGRAGAGKTTMMKAACEAWETAGYRVVGASLAGKAAEGLEKEAGIPSRTLSSWELRWSQDRDHLDDRTIMVLDEAGMVSSKQMALLVEAATLRGAKLVLVGDPDQLQPIEAGAAFRAIADRVGYAELETIYRQQEKWMRDASLNLARGNVGVALSAYEQAGLVKTGSTRQNAIKRLIAAWNDEFDANKSTLILAHRRRDVRELNELARAKLVERGIVGEGFAFRTEDGVRRFDAGDRIVFLKNEGSLGVKNGMLATVVNAGEGRMVAQIGEGESRRHINVEQRFYNHLDHGYAMTIHKSQGATVDRVKVLASNTLDRHLTYVAMTRHREAAELYFGIDEFTSRRGGILVGHGVAAYEHKPEDRDSYFVTLESGAGQRGTIWGIDLARAINEARLSIGDRIGLERKGSQTVRLPDGTTAERNGWQVVPLDGMAMARLSQLLARDASKETTLDYDRASSYRAALRFAEARGLHLMNVARTIARDRLAWTVRQRQRLVDLAERLAAIGGKIGLVASVTKTSLPITIKEKQPMVSGITIFRRSIEQAVEDKLAADPALKKQWEEVSMRFHHVYAQPEIAFKAANVDTMLHDPAIAAATVARMAAEPEAFGALKGKAGVFATRAEKSDRDRALKNVAPLAGSISDYLRQRGEAERRNLAEELATRRMAALEIPALSTNAKSVLERVRDAIDRNDLPAGLEYALADKMVKAELEGFARALTARFGERAFLGLAAKDADGVAYRSLAAGMTPAQKAQLQSAWGLMRTVQQLSAHERSTTALKQSEAMRQATSKGLSLK